jgi:hypothetical protein
MTRSVHGALMRIIVQHCPLSRLVFRLWALRGTLTIHLKHQLGRPSRALADYTA